MALTSRVAVVTGASRGLGLAIARTLLKNGAKVSQMYLYVYNSGKIQSKA